MPSVVCPTGPYFASSADCLLHLTLILARALGNTGLTVSALGFGGSALGGVFHAVSNEECIEVVTSALKAGVNVIDTAPWYGHGKAEEMLGIALKNIPRQVPNTHFGHFDACRDSCFSALLRRVSIKTGHRSSESRFRTQAYYLNTKVGRYDPDPVDMFNFSAVRVTEGVEDSLKRLQVDYIDIIQVSASNRLRLSSSRLANPLP
eukprot:1924473-Rhodomonas_salina.2